MENSKDCPNCKLINLPSALRCDCGFVFASDDIISSSPKIKNYNLVYPELIERLIKTKLTLKNKIIFTFLFILALLIGYGLIPYHGHVLDAGTEKPVEGVVVYIDFVARGGGEGSEYVNTAEDITDKKGYFSVTNKGWWTFNPIKFMFRSEHVLVFKSGYTPVLGSWRHINDKYWEKGTLNILLEKAGNFEERRDAFAGLGAISPDPDNRKLMDNEIKKERDILFPCEKEKKC